VSAVMLVTTTYAWYTISTAPEAKEIGTAVSGNGSLEVALMPENGRVGSIESGRGASGYYGGGSNSITSANASWGNLVSLIDPSYGLTKVTLNPIDGGFSTQNGFTFGTPSFGNDGRIISLTSGSAAVRAYNDSEGKFNKAATVYGVRGVVENEEATMAFGYVIDLALRVNAVKDDGTAAELRLQQTGTQRIYGDSISEITEGEGSYLEFTDTPVNLRNGLRIAFVQNYGNAAEDAEQQILAYAKAGTADAEGKCRLQLYSDKACTTAIENNVLVEEMAKNAVYQISVIVWLDGANATNADFSYNTAGTVKLNLQFATNVTLTPMTDIDVRDNPLAGNYKGMIKSALDLRKALLDEINEKEATARTPQESTFVMGYNALKAQYDAGTFDDVTYENAVTAITLLNNYAEAAIASQNP
ncbi:MAG: hypothetical protein II135_09040, partial [Clostridia bacterium]|nr:hypothetical protein [Clostridia bacterium]